MPCKTVPAKYAARVSKLNDDASRELGGPEYVATTPKASRPQLRLGVRGVPALVRCAIRLGIVRPGISALHTQLFGERR
jgi:hypothetical protein